MSRVYEDLDIDPDMQLTISEFVEIAEDVTDDMILNAIQPQTSEFWLNCLINYKICPGKL
jgi:plasmid maintenance system antidote protein VapI